MLSRSRKNFGSTFSWYYRFSDVPFIIVGDQGFGQHASAKAFSKPVSVNSILMQCCIKLHLQNTQDKLVDHV
ncbi:MAG: hypothetical protein H6731_09925 [Myxococcales bacterium]|nr:MAG: hypothetical protein H6731_09925 [Myxococcales bacterium]